MTEVIGVKFRTAGKVYYFSPKGVIWRGTFRKSGDYGG